MTENGPVDAFRKQYFFNGDTYIVSLEYSASTEPQYAWEH